MNKNEGGWRDVQLSNWRKRNLDFNVPACDVDMMLIEYDHYMPQALIEYKLEFSKWTDKDVKAQENLAMMASLPFFVVVYGEHLDWWKVIPRNDNARRFYDDATMLTEREFADFLYRLRGRYAPPDVLARLKNELPTAEDDPNENDPADWNWNE